MFLSRVLVFFLVFGLSGVVASKEVDEEQAARQMSILLKSYYPPTLNTLEKLGTIVPYVAYIKVDGTLGHSDLEGVEPTFDFIKVGHSVSLLYTEIAQKRDEFLVFSIFYVGPVEVEGQVMMALTAMMEHKSGYGYQKVWPLIEEGAALRIGKPLQLKYDPVVFTDK